MPLSSKSSLKYLLCVNGAGPCKYFPSVIWHNVKLRLRGTDSHCRRKASLPGSGVLTWWVPAAPGSCACSHRETHSSSLWAASSNTPEVDFPMHRSCGKFSSHFHSVAPFHGRLPSAPRRNAFPWIPSAWNFSGLPHPVSHGCTGPNKVWI